MFKSEEFKKLIGFDHTWGVIIAIVITGIFFPIIFLNDNIPNYIKFAHYNIPIGIFYASVVVLGNLYIFYRLMTKKQSAKTDFKSLVYKNLFYQLFYTIVASATMTMLAGNLGGMTLSWNALARNIFRCILLMAIYIGFYMSFYYLNQLKKSIKKQELLKRQNLESQLEILKNQVNPHFLFNSLNTLTSLIPEEPNLAVDYVQKLSKVYRYILEIKDKKLIPLQEELACIKSYLYMLNIRFGDKLQFEIDETELDFNHHVVPLSLQLLVENAVKHNIISNKKPLLIKIHKGKNSSLLVSNNLQPKVQKMPSTGTGLDNIRNRYKILSKEKVDVIVTNTHFTVSLPLVKVA